MTDFLLRRTDKIKSFRKANPNRVNLANLLLELEWELCSLVTSSEKIAPAIPVFLQQIHEYHCEGIIFIMRGRPVPAMAMMRLACELGRDTFRILEKPKRLQLFYDTSREKRRERTEVFRFDESNPGEKCSFKHGIIFPRLGFLIVGGPRGQGQSLRLVQLWQLVPHPGLINDRRLDTKGMRVFV